MCVWCVEGDIRVAETVEAVKAAWGSVVQARAVAVRVCVGGGGGGWGGGGVWVWVWVRMWM